MLQIISDKSDKTIKSLNFNIISVRKDVRNRPKLSENNKIWISPEVDPMSNP